MMGILEQIKDDYKCARLLKKLVDKLSRIISPVLVITITTFISARQKNIILTIQVVLIGCLVYAIFYKLLNAIVSILIGLPCMQYIKKQEVKVNDLEFISYALERLKELYTTNKIGKVEYYTIQDFLNTIKDEMC